MPSEQFCSCFKAQRILKQLPCRLKVEAVLLSQATGRVLRETATTDREQPPFDRVMMDGFAVRSTGESRRSWRVTSVQFAGDAPGRLRRSDEAIEVMTGTILPEGADSIVPLESVRRFGDKLQLLDEAQVAAGHFIHRRSSDLAAGEQVLDPGIRLGSAAIGLLATIGKTEVAVSCRPRVALLTTGNEVVPVEATPRPQQVRASNASAARAALLAAGAEVEWAHLQDDCLRLAAQLDAWLATKDVIVAIGGVSKGREDFLPELFGERGLCLFHRVDQRPGHPMGAWALGETAAFGLPGNPASALVCLHRYVLPFLEQLSGLPWPEPLHVPLAAEADWPKPRDSETRFLPVQLYSGVARPFSLQNSGDLVRLGQSQGFVEVTSAAGTSYPFLPFFPWR